MKEKPDKSAENEEEGRYFRGYENKELYNNKLRREGEQMDQRNTVRLQSGGEGPHEVRGHESR